MYVNRVLKGFSSYCRALSQNHDILYITVQARRSISTINRDKIFCHNFSFVDDKSILTTLPQQRLTRSISVPKLQFSQLASKNDDLGRLMYVGQDGHKIRSKKA